MVSVNWENVKESFNSLTIWMYWIVGLTLVTTISYVLYTRFNKQVASLLVFITSVMALYYYYVKWFVISDAFKIPVTFCPDFLTSVGAIGTDKDQFVCVDYVGISNDFYKQTTSYTIPTGLSDPNSGKGYVNHTSGYVITPKPTSSSTDIGTFCAALKDDAKLTWVSLCDTLA